MKKSLKTEKILLNIIDILNIILLIHNINITMDKEMKNANILSTSSSHKNDVN